MCIHIYLHINIYIYIYIYTHRSLLTTSVRKNFNSLNLNE